MKITIERATLLSALGHVQSVVERRNTIPILSNVLLAAEGSELSLTATDLDLTIIETVGTDGGQAAGQEPIFPCHNLLHGANKCGLAGLCNLDLLPPKGAVIIAPPLKIKEGSGSPTRVLALISS